MPVEFRSNKANSDDVNLNDPTGDSQATIFVSKALSEGLNPSLPKGGKQQLQPLTDGSDEPHLAVQDDATIHQAQPIQVLAQHNLTKSSQSFSISSQDGSVEDPTEYDRNNEPTTPGSNALTPARRDDRQIKNPSHVVRRARQTRAKRKIPQAMQAQWRIGAAPSVALALSREENQISKILSQAVAFHNSMFEIFWGPGLRDNRFIYDLDNRVEIFRDSSVTAACLVAAQKPNLAQEILDRVLPGMDDLLRNPHPGLYLILAELALGLVKTPNDSFRDQIARYMGSRALSILGRDHPLTSLLTLQLPQSAKEALGERLWISILPILAGSFGEDHYQSSTQIFCHARNMASCGRTEEAVKSLEGLLDYWSQLYGGNSLIVCYSKIELANMLVGTGSSMKAELVVSDALRTSDMIHAAELRNEECNASEKRHRKSSIAFPRVAALRTLGKVHSLRGNFGAASYYYSQAIAIGAPSLGKNCAVVELAQYDLDKVRDLELRQVMNRFSLDNATKLTDIIASPVC